MIINGRKLPECVKTANFDKEKDGARGYVYKYTYNGPVVKVKGFYYIGRRKIRGNIENYNQSSAHPQFNHYFGIKKSDFHYEILYSSPDFNRVVNKEAELLEKCVGVDPKCWNIHKPGKVGVENDAMLDKLFQDIKDSLIQDEEGNYDGPFKVEEVSPTKLQDVPFYQTRDTEYVPSLVRDIRIAIDDAGGIMNTNPVIVLEDRDESAHLDHDGGDLAIDGNNTFRGVVRSKHGKKVKRMVIPNEAHKFLTCLDTEALTGYLNGKKKQFQESNNLQKGVTYCLNEHSAGNNYKAKRVKERLLKMRFNSSEVSAIITKTKKDIAKQVFDNGNKVLITYGDGKGVDHTHPKIKSWLKKHNKGTSYGVVVRSGSVILDRYIYDMLTYESENDVKITDLWIGITHTDESLRLEWLNAEMKASKMQQVIDRLDCKNLEIHIEEVQPVYRRKTTKIKIK